MSYVSTWDWRGLCLLSQTGIEGGYFQYFYLRLVRIMSYISNTWDWRKLCSLSQPGIGDNYVLYLYLDCRGLSLITLPGIGEDYVLYLYLGLERIMSCISTWDWRGLYPSTWRAAAARLAGILPLELQKSPNTC